MVAQILASSLAFCSQIFWPSSWLWLKETILVLTSCLFLPKFAEYFQALFFELASFFSSKSLWTDVVRSMMGTAVWACDEIGCFSDEVIRLAVIKKAGKILTYSTSDLWLCSQGVEHSCPSRPLGPYIFPFPSLFSSWFFFLYPNQFVTSFSFFLFLVLSLQMCIVGSITKSGITEFKDMWFYLFNKSYQIALHRNCKFVLILTMCASLPIPSLILGSIRLTDFIWRHFCHIMA